MTKMAIKKKKYICCTPWRKNNETKHIRFKESEILKIKVYRYMYIQVILEITNPKYLTVNN